MNTLSDKQQAQELYDHFVCRKLDMLIEVDRLLGRNYAVDNYKNYRQPVPSLSAVKKAEELLKQAHWFDEDIMHLSSVCHNFNTNRGDL